VSDQVLIRPASTAPGNRLDVELGCGALDLDSRSSGFGAGDLADQPTELFCKLM
jgi:hypothetical protein